MFISFMTRVPLGLLNSSTLKSTMTALFSIRNTGEWSDTSAIKIPEIISSLNRLQNILSIEVAEVFVNLVVLVINGRKELAYRLFTNVSVSAWIS